MVLSKPYDRPSWHLMLPTYYGASMMKWRFKYPYRRHVPSSHYHYPEVSKIDGNAIDWLYGMPKSGYEATKIYGKHTLELKGMPMGRTPEFMQERLRRFYSKFGPVVHCRAMPHPLDPYQCEGTAFITFRNKGASMAAIKAPLRLCPSLHRRNITRRCLDTDKVMDGKHMNRIEGYDKNLLSIAEQLHVKLLDQQKPQRLDQIHEGLSEQGFEAGDRIDVAGTSVIQRFGNWEKFLSFHPFDDLFALTGDPELPARERSVRPKLMTAEARKRLLVKAKWALYHKLVAEVRPHWRMGKKLPEYVERQARITMGIFKDPLHPELQMMSRSRLSYKIYDEKFMYKMTLRKKRNEMRKENRDEYRQNLKNMDNERMEAEQDARRKLAAAAM